MIEALRTRFESASLDKILQHFRIEKRDLVIHEGFCSFVYEGFAQNLGKRVILKVSHAERLSLASLRDELSYVDQVAKLGARVCSPITSRDQILQLSDGQGSEFFCYLYDRVEGVGVDEREANSSIIRSLGETLGSFHAASKTLDHAKFENRKSFLEQDLVNYRNILPKSEIDTIECFDKIFSDLKALNITSENFGIIHGDAHDGNFLIGKDKITLIDFDEIERGFFLSDIASILESLCDIDGLRDETHVDKTFRSFIDGYRKHIDLASLDWQRMGLFMKFTWVSDHCLKHLLYSQSGANDFLRKRSLRRELFRSDFKEYDFLHRFDFAATVKQIS